MGKKTTLLWVYFLIIVFTFIIATLTVLARFATFVSPQESGIIAFLGLGILPLLALNVLLLIWWSIKGKGWLVLPLICLVLNWECIAGTIQIDLRSNNDTAEIKLKVASYNVHGYSHKNLMAAMRRIGHFMQEEKIDIVCLQETKVVDDCPIDTIQTAFPDYPYRAAHLQETGIHMIIFSKYPIVTSQLVTFPNTPNSAVWADIEINGMMIKVFNNHFQTTNINQSQGEIALLAQEGVTERTGKQALDVIIMRLYENFCKRNEQVEYMRSIIDETTLPVIVCGDFNDTPGSYTYAQMKKGLTDGFMSCGKGYGGTYQPLWGLLRVDYIFYNNPFVGVNYYSPFLTTSDHNPVIIELGIKN